MKVQCDGCGIEAASVFCCADEAALCDNCDRRVHRANKLASKHRRFSLLNPSCRSSSSSAQPPPLCDICQEKRGFLFCKEDRAILCRDCDVPIHTSSDLTKKHTRFLLTGVRLSSASITNCSAPSENIEQEVEKETITESNSYSSQAISQEEAQSYTGTVASNDGSSISNYLINTLPGWHVEEFFSGDGATGAMPVNAPPFTFISSNGFYQGEINPKGISEEYPIYANQEQNFYNGYTTLERWVPQIQTEFGTNTRQMPSSYHW